MTEPSILIDALENYDKAVGLKCIENPQYSDLDKFVNVELPNLIQERVLGPFITQPELSKVMQWKMIRGKRRAKLQEYIDALSDVDVRTASRSAFKYVAAGNVEGAFKALSKPLKGVGPATASIVLSAYDKTIPFMSDEALALLGHAPKYTISEGIELTTILRDIAEREVGTWSAQSVEHAIWASKLLPRARS